MLYSPGGENVGVSSQGANLPRDGRVHAARSNLCHQDQVSQFFPVTLVPAGQGGIHQALIFFEPEKTIIF